MKEGGAGLLQKREKGAQKRGSIKEREHAGERRWRKAGRMPTWRRHKHVFEGTLPRMAGKGNQKQASGRKMAQGYRDELSWP